MRRPIGPSVSMSLDLIRFCLALTVAAGHWSLSLFQTSWPFGMAYFGIASVGGFFVLSGYTIGMISPSRAGFEASRYFSDRLSRLWSVVLPALVLTCALDYAAYLINPAYYLGHWVANASHPVGRVLANLFFTNEIWAFEVLPFSNAPFWSLGYEAWFYVLFGLFMARRTGMMVLVAVLVGPNIVLLMLPWLIGVGLFAFFRRDLSNRQLWTTCLASLLLLAPCAVLLFGHTPVLLQAVKITGPIYARFAPFALDGPKFLVLYSSLLFVPCFAAVLSAAKLVDRVVDVPTVLVRAARALGEATFPLYLLHFPVFVLCAAIGFYDRTSPAVTTAIFIAVCCAIFLVTPLTDRFKIYLRGVLNGAVGVMTRRERAITPLPSSPLAPSGNTDV